MEADKLLEKLDEINQKFSDIESLIHVAKDSCEINNLYEQQLILTVICDSINSSIDAYDELQSDIYRLVKQTQSQQFPEGN